MDFDNTLYMSVLLVGAFICLHFYEASVTDEFIAHNAMLEDVVKDQKTWLDVLPFLILHNNAKSDEDVLKLEVWKRDVDELQKMVRKHNPRNLDTSSYLFAKYGIDTEYFFDKGEVSLLTQYNVFNRVLNQSIPQVEALQKREIEKHQKSLHVIITDRQSSYNVNEEYELELEVVDLCSDVENSEFFVEVDGKRDTVHSFPYVLPEKTNSGVIIGIIKNPSTGEVRTIKKDIFP